MCTETPGGGSLVEVFGLEFISLHHLVPHQWKVFDFDPFFEPALVAENVLHRGAFDGKCGADKHVHDESDKVAQEVVHVVEVHSGLGHVDVVADLTDEAGDVEGDGG